MVCMAPLPREWIGLKLQVPRSKGGFSESDILDEKRHYLDAYASRKALCLHVTFRNEDETVHKNVAISSFPAEPPLSLPALSDLVHPIVLHLLEREPPFVSFFLCR